MKITKNYGTGFWGIIQLLVLKHILQKYLKNNEMWFGQKAQRILCCAQFHFTLYSDSGGGCSIDKGLKT